MAWARLHGQHQPVAPLPHNPYPYAYPSDTPNVPMPMPQSPEPIGQPMHNAQEEAPTASVHIAPELPPQTVPMHPAPAYVPPSAPTMATMAPKTPSPLRVRPAPSVKPTNETLHDVLRWPAIIHSQPIPTYPQIAHSSTIDVSSKIIARRNLDAISRSFNRRAITRRRGQLRYNRRIRAPAAAWLTNHKRPSARWNWCSRASGICTYAGCCCASWRRRQMCGGVSMRHVIPEIRLGT